MGTLAQIDPVPRARSGGEIPAHVAIIMDGNGRWASARGLPRIEGHRRGVESVRRTVRHAGDRGVRVLTLFTFSSENWSRPRSEINDLFNLLRFFIRNDLAELKKNGVRIRVIGRREGVPKDIAALVEKAETETRGNEGLVLQVAFNYGGRDELVRAMRRIGEKMVRGEIDPADFSERVFAEHLDTAGISDPDLLIRTSGEARISNFLLWQLAYTEFVFLPVYWPDFDENEFDAAIAEFHSRDRRFGGLTGV
ncbi:MULTISPECIES: isoprenyl transferase [Afifella]|uniref:Isoprenyl transferase n=1 Tax=Afifella marina DSM 2698 TaxID=1120955 RepID=A0A1G5NJL8_AFIMA|nr:MULTISPECIES: isoprenyl transferase [Afifella]MBK1623671.1 di-trans,poly-cis-decaprenylcistransferase [Afifella marina DSM 2698]MBK1626664.1 di-trans,poly-cis-decaprenylcistransferase [Afifella marina]MBK5916213.1 di-trans,poly-cis-decaprenylcistransferase [Afifella marina]MCF1502712.1 isoprenyl transferase [Afifella sp. H1R]RAI21590.1 di-trans,poly-cis-decaprenylcistransferase [Afifella marina DSM 2698]